MLLIKNGLIHDAVNREPYRADILIENGKIARIAPEIAACMGPTLAAAPPPPSRSIKSSSRLSAKPITAMLQYRRLISPHARFVSRMSEGIEPATRPQKRNISGVS